MKRRRIDTGARIVKTIGEDRPQEIFWKVVNKKRKKETGLLKV